MSDLKSQLKHQSDTYQALYASLDKQIAGSYGAHTIAAMTALNQLHKLYEICVEKSDLAGIITLNNLLSEAERAIRLNDYSLYRNFTQAKEDFPPAVLALVNKIVWNVMPASNTHPLPKKDSASTHEIINKFKFHYKKRLENANEYLSKIYYLYTAELAKVDKQDQEKINFINKVLDLLSNNNLEGILALHDPSDKFTLEVLDLAVKIFYESSADKLEHDNINFSFVAKNVTECVSGMISLTDKAIGSLPMQLHNNQTNPVLNITTQDPHRTALLINVLNTTRAVLKDPIEHKVSKFESAINAVNKNITFKEYFSDIFNQLLEQINIFSSREVNENSSPKIYGKRLSDGLFGYQRHIKQTTQTVSEKGTAPRSTVSLDQVVKSKNSFQQNSTQAVTTHAASTQPPPAIFGSLSFKR